MAKKAIATVAGVEYRARTGALRIGSDWPGVFLRGDEAMSWSAALELAASELIKRAKQDPEARELGNAALELRKLNALLKSARVTGDEHARIARERDAAF